MTAAWQVGRLKVAAPASAAVGSFARTLETALRLAPAPRHAAGELVLIRHLDLGPVRAGTSAHALADRLATLLAGTRPVRLRADEAERPDEAVVSFASTIDALAMLLLRAARRQPLRAWYWRRVLPALRERAGLPEVAAAALALAQAEGRGIAGAAALAERLLYGPDGGPVLEAVLLALPADAANRPWSAFLPDPEPAPAAIDARQSQQGADALLAAMPWQWRTIITRIAARLAPDDPRLAWIVAAAAVAVFSPAIRMPPIAVILASLARVQGRHPRRSGPAVPELGRGHPSDRSAQARASAAQEGTPAAARASSMTLATIGPAIGPVLATEEERLATAADSGGRAIDARPFSRWAGLWLLPAALARLRSEDVMSCFGDALGLAVMRALAARLRVPPDDPALAGLPQALPADIGPFLAPTAWRRLAAPHARATPAFALRRAGVGRLLSDRAGRLPLAWAAERRDMRALVQGGSVRGMPESPPPGADLPRRAAYLALVRDLRRHAGMSPRRLVRRVGLIQTTAMHVAVTFPGRLIELPLRRAGLDLDPGWVPWLGRVVTYHYDLEGEVFQ